MNVGEMLFGLCEIALAVLLVYGVLYPRSFLRRWLSDRYDQAAPVRRRLEQPIVLVRERWPWWQRMLTLLVLGLVAWAIFIAVVLYLH